MAKERLVMFFLAAISLTACNEQSNQNANNSGNASYAGRSYSVIGRLRPQADPNLVNQIHNEEEAARRAQEAAAAAQMQKAQPQGNDPNQRNLPGVGNTSLIAGMTGTSGGSQPQASLTAAQQKQLADFQAQTGGGAPASSSSWSAPVSTPPPPPAASYGVNYTSPSPGFVPPPPAVSLSVNASPYGGPPPQQYNPYANPYEYASPGQPAAPTRAPSSGFGAVTSGAKAAASSGDSDEPKKKKEKPIQIITPTGMEARSAYKQRDEMRILWKGALGNSLAGLNSDPKVAEGLSKVDVGLPGESSKGSLSVAQRQIDNMFKNNGAVDKKVIAQVKKTQADLAQAYYRYLYAYNKFFLTQQQVQARKQELECAETQAERQRATVDLANSQQEADASKEDMRSSHGDLAAVAGAAAARAVIKGVSGVAPSLEQIAQADQAGAQAQKDGGGGLGGILNVFGFGKGKPKEKPPADEAPKVVAEQPVKEKKEKEVKDKKKGKKGDKGEKAEKAEKPAAVAAKPAESAPPAKARAEEAPAPANTGGSVSFELKDVKTTPRKSILRVVVKNAGGDNFSFDADSISVAEGNNKLAEASVSAEFDSTIVQPSGEVSGTITIFGRPWNDKLTVSLSNGSKPIFLHR